MESAPEQLLGISEVSGKSPKTRLKDGHSARLIIEQLLKDDEPRGRKRAVIKGMIDGNPPYSAARQKAAGLDWCANLNLMEGDAIMTSSGVPYYSLFNGVEHYAETRTAYQPEHPDHELWHGKIAVRFHNLLKRWTQFDWHMQLASYQMRLHGIGPCFHDRDGDWRFRALSSGQVKVPRKSPSCLDHRIHYFAVIIPYSAVELWERIADEETAAKVGWNVEAVKNALKRAAKGVTEGGRWETTPWEKYQQAFKNDDLLVSQQSDEIVCGHLFVQEFAEPGQRCGKISHFIVTETAVVGENRKENDDRDFLFKHPNRFDSYEEVMTCFFQNIGDGTWHSVRGIAGKAFKHLEVINRLDCRTIDGAFMKSSLVLQSNGSKSADKMQLVQIGPYTLLPANLELKQLQMSGMTEEAMAVSRLLSNKLASNIGQSGSRSLSREDGRGEMPTATQVNQQVAKESSLDHGQMTQFYLTLDQLYTEIFERAADPATTDAEAKRFQEECAEDGVPKKALAEMEFVRANRASGYGSPQMRQLTDQQMMPLVPMLPEDGKQNFLEDAVAGIKGADKVRRYVPREHIPSQDESIAALENAMIAGGRAPVLAAGQNDVLHLHSHLEDTANTLEPLHEMMEAGELDQAALQQGYQYLQIMGPHVEAHLGRIMGDATRKGAAQMFKQQLANIVAFHGKLRSAIRTAQNEARLAEQQEAQATALGALDEAKVRSVETDMALRAQKTAAGIEDKRVKTAAGIRFKAIQTAETIRQKRALEMAETEAAA